MKKSSLFISTVLTTFVLTILGGVFKVYRPSIGNQQAPVLQSTQAVASAIPTTPSVANSLTPQEAAQIAAHFTGYGNLYSVESAVYSGIDTYKVTFSSGNLAYVDLQGKLVAAFLAPKHITNSTAPTAPSSPPEPSASTSTSSGSHESDDHGGGD